MFKIALSILALTTLSHATDQDPLVSGGSIPLNTIHETYVQPMSEVVYEEVGESTASRAENLVTVAHNHIEMAKIKGGLEWQRTQNHVGKEIARFDKKVEDEANRSSQKLHKLEKKSDKKLKKLKNKGKKIF